MRLLILSLFAIAILKLFSLSTARTAELALNITGEFGPTTEIALSHQLLTAEG